MGNFPNSTRRGGRSALPTGAPPTANCLPRTPAPPAALKFVKTISGTPCLGLGGQSRTCAGPSGEGSSSLAVRWPGPVLGWIGRRKSGADGRCVIAVPDCSEVFTRVDSGTADLPAFFCTCEPQMLRPGLTGVHSREFPGQWWKYESLRGFSSNRLTAEADMDSRVVHVMDPAGCPQVLIGPKLAQGPATPSKCSNEPIISMDERVGVTRNLLETLSSPQ